MLVVDINHHFVGRVVEVLPSGFSVRLAEGRTARLGRSVLFGVSEVAQLICTHDRLPAYELP
jgi:hypothetical protein